MFVGRVRFSWHFIDGWVSGDVCLALSLLERTSVHEDSCATHDRLDKSVRFSHFRSSFKRLIRYVDGLNAMMMVTINRGIWGRDLSKL